MPRTTDNGNGRDGAGHSVGDKDLQSSNQTVGLFLGSVPRGWMLSARDGHNPTATFPNVPRNRTEAAINTAAVINNAAAAASPPSYVPTPTPAPTYPNVQLSDVSQSPCTAVPRLAQVDTSLDYRSGAAWFMPDGDQPTFSEPQQAPETTLSSASHRSQGPPLPHPVASETTSFPDQPALQSVPVENSRLVRHNTITSSNTANVNWQPSTAQNLHHRRQSAPGSTPDFGGHPAAITSVGRHSANANHPLPSPNMLSVAPPQGSSITMALTSPQNVLNDPLIPRPNASSIAPGHPSTSIGPPPPLTPPHLVHPDHLNSLNKIAAALVAKRPMTIVEAVRVTWLRGACEQGDLFFLLLHQLTCLQTGNRQFLVKHLSFAEVHLQGLSLLNMILADCKGMSPEALNMFCNFPTPFTSFSANETLRPWIRGARRFLGRFVVNWEKMRTRIFSRGYPPSAREIADELNVNAMVLSQAIYTNLFHQLFPQPHNGMMQDGYNLFRLSQQELVTPSQPDGALWNVPLSLKERELQMFRLKFHQILLAHQQMPLQTFQPLYTQPPVQPSHQSNLPGNMTAGTGHQVNSRSMTSQTPPGANRPGSFVDTLGRPRPHVAPNNAAFNVPQGPSLLMPQRGRILPITVNPNPNRVALHQAHLVNPMLEAEDSSDGPDKGIRLYSFLESFVGKPSIVDSSTVYENVIFEISPEIFERRAQDRREHNDNLFGRAVRILRDGSVLFHMRCVRLPSKEQPLDPENTSALATSWPEHIYLSINGTHLEFRRKVLHGKDLPVDVTHLVQLGANELILSYHTTSKETSETFAVALEVIQVLSHAATLQLPSAIDAQTSLDGIVRSLQLMTEDDDVVMADAHISIDLIDPFTARIFDRPVRGRLCRHRECFDFVSYLQSRICRDKDGFVHPDEWKCPLCGKDARPSNLVVDSFLLRVKEKLIADGQSHTKAILVKENGSWEAKENDVNMSRTDQSRKSSEPQGMKSASVATEVQKKMETPAAVSLTRVLTEPEVIILDDDE